MEIMCLAGISHDYFQSDHFSSLVSTLVRILSAVNEKKAFLAHVPEAHSFRHGWIKPQMTPPC